MNFFIVLNNYGIQKYILKENIELPTPENANLLRLRNAGSYFSDIKWAFNGGSINVYDKQKSKDLKNKILVSSRVLGAIEKEAMKRM